jgi:hypothetical protein
MRRLVLAAAIALAAAAPAAAYDAGVAVTDITPPPAGAADPTAYALPCALFNGPRVWAFDEPYSDLNGNARYDDVEPSCDANLNGRRDRIWYSGAEIGDPLPAAEVHDPITARAFAIRSDGKTAVVVSVAAQGLFNTYIDRAVAQARQLNPAIDTLVVSANHNESSPDTIGIYGGPATPAADPLPGLPARTGIDDYYMDFLVARIAQAADQAVKALTPATLHVRKVPLPANLHVQLSDNWPTTDNGEDKPAAIDPKLGVIQARATGTGTPIFTVLNLAAHNQEIGHSDKPDVAGDISSDWPGSFAARVAAKGGGTGIFLVGANGSEEDPVTVPAQGGEGTYAQAQATGEALADATLAAAQDAGSISDGPLRYARRDFCVPLENTLFKAAAAIGLFGARQTYVVQSGQCIPAATAPDGLLTTVGLLDVGPQLQLILNPGEAFPALLMGSRWGIDDVPEECRGRANPRVPTWLSHAPQRFQVGLANDFIGYLIPPWAYIGQAGVVATANDPDCNSGAGSDDSAGHHHKLETEGVGPTASAAVANQLAALQDEDPTLWLSGTVVPGRYVLADGTLSRSPIGAKSVVLEDGRVFGAPFIDYDGAEQPAPDLLTRGVLVRTGGCAIVEQRYYVDVFAEFKPAPGRRARQGCIPPDVTPTPTLTPTPEPRPISRRVPTTASRRCGSRARRCAATGCASAAAPSTAAAPACAASTCACTASACRRRAGGAGT